MRRTVLALVLALVLLPGLARAASWSFSTPYGSTSGSLDPSSVNFSSTGALSLSATSVGWDFSLDKASTTVTGSATVNDQAYSGSFD